MEDFGLEYFGKQHTHYLQYVLKEHYTITEDWNANKFDSIDLDWEYQKQNRRISMKDYIYRLLIQHSHHHSTKRQILPHRHADINYGAKAQCATKPEPGPTLHDDGIKRVQ